MFVVFVCFVFVGVVSCFCVFVVIVVVVDDVVLWLWWWGSFYYRDFGIFEKLLIYYILSQIHILSSCL